jgi:anti-sigma factor RsiW
MAVWVSRIPVALGLLACLLVASAQAELEDAERAAVERLLEAYFERWSAADFDGYGALFHPTAVIHHVDDAGRTTRQALRAFLRGQRRAHARSPGRTEVPLSMDIEEQRPGFVRALVHWELREGDRRERGYDHFFLRREDGTWRILSLVFHGE